MQEIRGGMHSTRVKRLLFVSIALIGIILLLSSCARTPRVKNENEMIQDMAAFPSWCHGEDLPITDVSVIKRQTNEQNMSDTVYVTMTSENEDVRCTVGYILYYNLYDKGWLLDAVDEYPDGGWEAVPLHGVSDDVIESLMESYITSGQFDSMEVLGKEEDLEHGWVSVRFSAVKDHLYGTEYVEIEQGWEFYESSLSFCPKAEYIPIMRTLDLKETIIGATWTCNRHYGQFDPWADKFTVTVGGLEENNGDMLMNLVVFRERNTDWDVDSDEKVNWGLLRELSLEYITYDELEQKWTIPFGEAQNEYLFSEDDSDCFVEGDYFCFDLDTPGAGWFK